MPTQNFELEVCVDRVDHALFAAEAGATRIEMNSALAMSGLTPSLGSVEWLVKHCPVPVVVMLRPHDSGFQYSSSEQVTLLRDCELMLSSGAAGVVCGCLNEAGEIDLRFLHRIVTLCRDAGRDQEVVFHRAFDELADQLTGLKQLIGAGVTRVLTSGGAPTALQGSEQLARLIDLASGQIEVLPGAGINAACAQEVLQKAGGRQLHGSFTNRATPQAGPVAEQVSAVRQILERQFGRRTTDSDQ